MAAKKRNALGRGLGALLDQSDVEEKNSKKTTASKSISLSNFQEVPLDQIETNPYQPRTHFDEEALQELSSSIKLQGIIQPITVRRLEAKKYQLISGERRFQASKLAGLEKVPAYIREVNDQEMLEMALIENIQRENLNAIEVALSYQRLMNECGLIQENLGERVGKKRSTVNNYLRLLRLPPDIQHGIKEKQISMGHARALVSIETIDVQLAIYKKIIEEELSVRKVEELVRGLTEEKKEAPKKASKNDSSEVLRLTSSLSSHFGTKVNVNSNDKYKGEIKIPFVSLEDLNRILEILDIKG